MSADPIDSYIEDLRSALNEHGVERMDDLPASVLARFAERGVEMGLLDTDESKTCASVEGVCWALMEVLTEMDEVLMIEVKVAETGDCAEAGTPELAVFAARTIGQEAKEHVGIQGFDPTLIFSVADKPVARMTLRDLNR